MAKQSSVNLDITNNPDGFDISGGTTVRKLGITGGDVTIAGSGSATVTFPTTSTTIAGLGITQSFSALQSFSAGISASGATFSGNISAPNIVNSFNGLTGAVQGVSQVNGLTGAIINVGFTSGKLSQFASTTSAELASIISNETGGGGVLVFNTSPTITTSITTASTSFALVNTTATTLNLGGAATTLTMGGTSGIASIRNPTLTLGNTNNTIATNSGTTNYLAISPYGNISLAPTTTAFSVGGSLTTLVVNNGLDATGQVQISGGDFYLGVKSTNGEDSESVNIIFEGATDNTNETTLTVVDPTADRTITFPDASGTVALTNGLVSSLSGSTYISVSGSTGAVTITNTGVQTFNGLTGAVTGVTVGGTNVFTSLNSFNAGISASGGITLNGYLTGSTGFLFGPTSAFLQFVPMIPNSGGLLLRNGIFQVGNNPIAYGSGFLNVDPNAERMVFNGRTEMYVNAGYQTTQSAYSIAIGTSHVGDPIRIAKQTSIGSIDTTKLIAGCDVNGIWYGAGFSGGSAGSTFSSTTNTLDVIASTDGAGLRIAKAITGSQNRIGGIRLGRAGSTGLNTYLENNSGTFTIYNGVDTTGSKIVDFTATTTGFSGAVSATGLISANAGISALGITFGDQTYQQSKTPDFLLFSMGIV